MTQVVEQNLLSKVRKLLAKAEDPACTPAEAEAFNAKAADLIAKYGIDRALAYADGKLDDSVADRVIVLDDPYARQKAQLLVEIAYPLRVQVVMNTDESRRINGFKVHMFGFESDIERVDLLLTSLLVQAAHGLVKVRPASTRTLSPSQLAAFRRDWLTGFGIKVRMRLTEAERRAVGEQDESTGQTSSAGTSTELVLAKRTDLVDQALAAAYAGKLREAAARRRRYNAEAFRSGVAAGATADLGQNRINQNTQQKLTRRTK